MKERETGISKIKMNVFEIKTLIKILEFVIDRDELTDVQRKLARNLLSELKGVI